ncbi:hypothetical protein [Aquimarina agarilytica]|uniref:hypothetical protein n=1 Tax=Aquimarina agarilytica TaxID=1087449 RepID=UPI000288EC31|nr:hypothetical protein [Aquimarina agarilytica]
MCKNRIILILLTTGLCSCNYFDFKKKDRHVIAKQQLKEIKARPLDTYPLLEVCETETKIASKKCFEEQITSHILGYFEEEYIVEESVEKDTLWVKIAVSKKGDLILKSATNASDYANFEFIKEKLEQALFDVSPIQPAIVHGVKVASVFQLPLIIDNNK